MGKIHILQTILALQLAAGAVWADNAEAGKDKAVAKDFNPQNYHPATWLKAAKKAGFEYVVLTCRHQDGFALWPSAYGNFSTKNYMCVRGLVKEMQSKYADVIKVVLYTSPPNACSGCSREDHLHSDGH